MQRLFLQEELQDCRRQQEKRRVTTHWIDQCQRNFTIRWIGKCQSRSPEDTETAARSEEVHSHSLVKPSPVSSASASPSAGYQAGYDCSRQCLFVVYAVFDVVPEGSVSPLPPIPVSFLQYRCFLSQSRAGSLFRRPIFHSSCCLTPTVLPPSFRPLSTGHASTYLYYTSPPLFPASHAAVSPRAAASSAAASSPTAVPTPHRYTRRGHRHWPAPPPLAASHVGGRKADATSTSTAVTF